MKGKSRNPIQQALSQNDPRKKKVVPDARSKLSGVYAPTIPAGCSFAMPAAGSNKKPIWRRRNERDQAHLDHVGGIPSHTIHFRDRHPGHSRQETPFRLFLDFWKTNLKFSIQELMKPQI